jgi:hypothetical protein
MATNGEATHPVNIRMSMTDLWCRPTIIMNMSEAIPHKIVICADLSLSNSLISLPQDAACPTL